MTNKEKENLKEVLAKGQTDIVISKISEIAKKEVLEDIYNEILVISSNYESAKNQFILNISKNDEWNMQLAKINSGILYVIDKMPIDDRKIQEKTARGKKLKRETNNSKLKNDIESVNSLFIQAIEIVKKELKNENNYGYANKVLDTLIKLYSRCQNQTFQIAVMALVKSGKSTFLNALLGNEYLPMANVPETAIPVRIHHKETDEKDRQNHGELRNSRLNAILANGANKILEQLKVLNKRERDDALTGMEYNLILEAPLKILEKKDLGDIKFEILDTPGFGEAELESLRGTNHSINKSINEIIEEIGVIIYLLDYTKLRTQEEAEVMEKLSVLREDLLDKVQERLFFIVNKIDLRDRNGLSPKETITYVHQLVSPKVPKIKEEQIFTLSSYDALLSRLILDNIASDKAKLDFTNTAFGRSKKEATDEELKNIAPIILAESNILLIEENIINYIYNNRMKLLVQDLLTGLERQMLEYKNKVIETAIGTLNLDRLKIAELETKIEEAKKKSGEIEDKSKDFERSLKVWIDKQFIAFKATIQNEINDVFVEEKPKSQEPTSNKDKKDSKPWLLRQLSEKIMQIFSPMEAEEDKSLSEQKYKKGIEEKVDQLNNEIFTYLQIQFKDFKKSLEYQILEKQKELFNDLQSVINKLASEFEGTLKKSLKINLKPVTLQLDEIDPEEVLKGVTETIDRFIQKREREKLVKKTRTVYHEGSFCENGYYTYHDYYENEKTVEFEIKKEKVLAFWLSNTEMLNNNANHMTSRFVDSFISSQIVSAKRKFYDYVNDYLLTIKDEERKLSEGGKLYIDARLKELNATSLKIEKMLTLINEHKKIENSH